MPESRMVTVNGKPLVCGHCGNDRFSSRKAQLNTAAATFFNMDWLNQSADVFVCSGCGQLFWFLNESGIATGEGGSE